MPGRIWGTHRIHESRAYRLNDEEIVIPDSDRVGRQVQSWRRQASDWEKWPDSVNVECKPLTLGSFLVIKN